MSAPAGGGRRAVAVLIGVSGYARAANEFSRIPAVEQNIKKLEKVLKDPGSGVCSSGKVKTVHNPEHAGVVWERIDAAAARAEDVLLCYYSGHARVDDRYDKLYLSLSDCTPDNLFVNGLAVEDLLKRLEEIRHQCAPLHIVLVLDCCYSGQAVLEAGTEAARAHYWVLASTSATREVSCEPSGEDGCTPFTREFAAVLSDGVPHAPRVTMGALCGRLEDTMRQQRTEVFDPWLIHYKAGPEVVVSHARDVPGDGVSASESPQPALLASLGSRLQALWRLPGVQALPAGILGAATAAKQQLLDGTVPLWRRCVAWLAVVAALGGLAAGVQYGFAGSDTSCPPPLELRVLTSPEIRGAVRTAATAYEESDANQRALRRGDGHASAPDGCRAVHLTVFDAPSDKVGDAFARADTWSGSRVSEDGTDSGDPVGAPPEDGAGVDPADPTDAFDSVHPSNPDTTGQTASGTTSFGSAGATAGGSSAGTAGGTSVATAGGSSAGTGTSAATPGGSADSAKHFIPLNDVGPQPDIWIPDTSAEVALAREATSGSPVVRLGTGTPVAYSPLVLGLPSRTAVQLPGVSVEITWNDLLKAVSGLPDPPRLLRPSPTTSGAGLLHTVGRYLAGDGSLPDTGADTSGGLDTVLAPDVVAAIEQKLSASGFPSGDSTELLDRVAHRAAARPGRRIENLEALVSEKALVDFNRAAEGAPGTGDGGDRCSGFRAAESLTAYYLKGVPALDHPFVPVSWTGADEDRVQRSDAVNRFRAWLLGKDGQSQLAAADYRKARTGGVPPLADHDSALGCSHSGAQPSIPIHAADLTARRLRAVIGAYDKARAPSRVLILLDVSPSMREGRKKAEAEAVVARALEVLGPEDTFGVWAYPKSDTQRTGHRELVPLGTGVKQAREGLRAVEKAELGRTTGTAMYEVLTKALDTMRHAPGKERTEQAILLVTDGGDDREPGDKGQATAAHRFFNRLKDDSAATVPFVVVDVGRPGCGAYELDIISGSSQCLPAKGDVAKELAGKLAVVDTPDPADGRTP
ncbi:vWA domain-containing protein [Wenjunlia tyrosinilytica]|uniref:VWFA domain-containing protein n=1 Tax=Wenjunlia tyrosinilytica TaxID=1544741 RepID=A0A917ZKE8_9ACTN|nr:vWA domain-containing protein [Wenjunlia tyrosinilytica]GGO85225.1 hypothetical protein GCM10012280_18520 [Wenjunlia tyrosinilytica]